MSFKKIALSATTFAGVALLGVSLSAGSVQAKASHVHMAHAHHHLHGVNPVAAGADVAAGALGVAGAVVASVAQPWTDSSWQGSYYQSSPWGDYDCHPTAAFGCRPYRAWGAQ